MATKTPRGRRPAGALRFPMYDLDMSIDVSRALHERAGGTAAAEALAEYLGYSGVHNGSFINRTSAARMFGLIEGPPNAITLSPRARQILMPDYEDVERQSRLDAFFDVPLYSEFFKEYTGRQLPPTEGMVNALVSKFTVGSKQAAHVLSRLLDSAEQAGLFSIAGARTKMIRPSLGPGREAAGGSGDERQEPTKLPSSTAQQQGGRYPKLIEGALEQLPKPGQAWSEKQMSEWFELLKLAVRVVYRPTPGEPQTSSPDEET